MDMWVYVKRKEELRESCWDWSSLMIKKGKLRQFGHAECKGETDWLKCCTAMEVEGRNRTKGTSKEDVMGWCEAGYQKILSITEGCTRKPPSLA